MDGVQKDETQNTDKERENRMEEGIRKGSEGEEG